MKTKDCRTDQEFGAKTVLVCDAPRVKNITKFLQTGVKDMVLKPYSPKELAELLKQ